MSSPDPSAQKARDGAERVLVVCDVIAAIVDAGEAAFLRAGRAQWAAEMGLIRIGEAVGKIPAEVRERFPDQPWRQIIDMRNFAAHQYDDLDPRRVWRTLVRDVPRASRVSVRDCRPGARRLSSYFATTAAVMSTAECGVLLESTWG